MRRNSSPGSRMAWGVALGLGGLLTAFSACSVDEIDHTGKKCPCASGWVCDPSTDTCVKPGADAGGGAAGADAGGGTGGTSVGGTSGSAGVSGQAGAGGTAGAAGAAGAAGSGGAAGGCGTNQKWCDGGCVSSLSTTHGCNGPSCDPCTDYPNSSPTCSSGACSIYCSSGWGNCDGNLANGCEQHVDVSDAANCGKCGRTCSANHASSTSCDGASCKPVCTSPYANCNESSKLSPDDGCESNLNSSSSHCGRCGYKCSAQGGVSSKFTCYSGICGCGSDAQCMTEAGMTAAICDTTQHLCVCGSSTCGPAEVCVKQGGTTACACNGVAKCTGGTFCCSTGCKNLDNDAANCGVCGKVCATGQTCTAGVCG